MSLLKRRICLFLNCSFLLPLLTEIPVKIKDVLTGVSFSFLGLIRSTCSNTCTVYRCHYIMLNIYPVNHKKEMNTIYFCWFLFALNTVFEKALFEHYCLSKKIKLIRGSYFIPQKSIQAPWFLSSFSKETTINWHCGMSLSIILPPPILLIFTMLY